MNLCDRCLERAASSEFERRGEKYKEVRGCCGIPRGLSAKRVREIAQSRRAGQSNIGVRRLRQFENPVQFAKENPILTGAVIGLGLVAVGGD
jgi:hypothetical protein